MTDRDTLMVEARRRAREARVDPAIMAAAMVTHRRARPFVVEVESRTAGETFFRVEQEGPSKVLYLNQGHPFYDTIYDPPGATSQYRAAMEVLLWTIGLRELESDGQTHQQYLVERQRWSHDLMVAAPILDELLDYPGARALEADEEWGDDVLPPINLVSSNSGEVLD